MNNQAIDRLQRGESDVRFLVVRTPSGIDFFEPGEPRPESDFKVLGVIFIARGEDGSLATGMNDETVYRARMPEHLRRACPPITEEEKVLFNKLVRIVDVTLNELVLGVRQTVKLNEIWEAPVSADMLGRLRAAAREIAKQIPA